jgi:hypothetical protein
MTDKNDKQQQKAHWSFPLFRHGREKPQNKTRAQSRLSLLNRNNLKSTQSSSEIGCYKTSTEIKVTGMPSK